MNHPSQPAEHWEHAIRAMHPRQMAALPLIAPILNTLQVRAQTNARVPTQADVDLGQIVVILVLNRLLGVDPVRWLFRRFGA